MATKKVRIYKSQDGKGAYINNTAKFLNKALPKAKYGRSKNYSLSDVMDTIFDEVALENTEDDVVDTLQQQYGMSYNDAMDAIDAYKDVLEVQKTKDEEVVDLLPETDDNFGERYNYNLNEKWASEGNDDSWEDEEVDDLEDTGNELKRGGSISRSKFVKKVVKGLKKANEGLEQTNSNTGNILDTPINGRESFLNNFKRGVKDLGNEFYAKKIYDGMPMAQDGMEMQDVENPMHHLQAYGDTTSEIFQKPMNQVHGAGYEIPQARRGREQRQQRQMNKDWNKMFGNIAAGNISLPGLPSYIGTISPQIIQAQPGTNQGAAGPLMDVQFKKGPWWKGTREWSIKGMPVQPMMGRSMGVMPGYGYMPSNYGYGSSWSRSYTYPGKVISQVASAVNAAADPGKNADAAKLKNNPIATSGSYGPGYEGFNADSNGNGIADYLEVASTPAKTAVEKPEVSVTPKASNDPKVPVAPQVMTPDRLSEIEREYGDIRNEPGMFATPEEFDQYMATNPTNAQIDNYLNKKMRAAYDDTYDDPAAMERVKRGVLEARAMEPINAQAMYSNPMMMNTYTPQNIPVTSVQDLPEMLPIKNLQDFQLENPGMQQPIRSLPTDTMPIEMSPVESESPTSSTPTWSVNTSNLPQQEFCYGDKCFQYAGGSKGSQLQEAIAIDSLAEALQDYDPKNFSNLTLDELKTIIKNKKGKAFGDDNRVNKLVNTKEGERFLNKWLEFQKDRMQYFDNPTFKSNDPLNNPYKTSLVDPSARKGYEASNVYSDFLSRYGKFKPGDDPNSIGSAIGPLSEEYENYQTGGFIDSSNPDLYKFIYGGDEPEDISNVVYYDDNDIDTKDVEDPYFREGGLYKADGGWQVTDPNNRIKTQAPNQYQSPAYKQYNPNATAQSNYNSFMELQRRGLSQGQYNPSKSYDTSNTSGRIIDMRNSGNQGGFRVGDQVIYNQGQDNYGGGYSGGYMMNRPSTLKQFVNMFNPIQKDGVWLSQTGPARTMSGQPYNPRVNQMATAGYTDAAGNVVKPRAGYVQDYEVQKGPWYTGGKTTMKVTNRWSDPNAGNYLGPVDPNAKPMTNQPVQSQGQGQDSGIISGCFGGKCKEQGQGQPSATNKPATAQQNTERKPAGMTVTKADGNQIKGVNEKGELVSQQLESSRRKFRDRNAEKQYGGDTESYPDLYEFQGVNNSQVGFSGMGPFDPNANNTGGIGEGKVGPCNEDEVVNPNSPCYDPSYKPGDFTTEYKANQARTFKPKKLSNLFKAAGAGTRNISGIANNLNADSNLAANTTSDNRTGTNYLDYSGGVSGQTQRNMSKTQGAGATGFNSIVGNAAFVKKGGQIEYKEGGVYDLSQEEIGKILAAGGQIKFL